MQLAKQLAKYGAVLIGVYLGVEYATGAEGLLSKLSRGIQGETKTLQGR